MTLNEMTVNMTDFDPPRTWRWCVLVTCVSMSASSSQVQAPVSQTVTPLTSSPPSTRLIRASCRIWSTADMQERCDNIWGWTVQNSQYYTFCFYYGPPRTSKVKNIISRNALEGNFYKEKVLVGGISEYCTLHFQHRLTLFTRLAGAQVRRQASCCC